MSEATDTFLKLFNFYLQNPLPTVRQKFKDNTVLYQDSAAVYLKSLTFNSETSLSYADDSELIQISLDTREKMNTFFNSVMFPGSYAYGTKDSNLFRQFILDWTSTIKSIQNNMRRCTDIFALNSDDVDKAIQGFGVDFITAESVTSLAKRQHFLSEMCNLYKIKGTPQSIIRALQLIGRTNIVVREFWIVQNGQYIKKDIRIKCTQTEKNQQTFNDETGGYEVNPITVDESYMTYDWFIQKLKIIGDPHWMYSKREITDINWSDKTWMRLPSITPYFSVEFYNDIVQYQSTMSNIQYLVNKQYQAYLKYGSSILINDQSLWINGYDSAVSLLECYTALQYTYIRRDEHDNYTDLHDYLKARSINAPDFEYPNAYFNLILWCWNNAVQSNGVDLLDLLKFYVPVKSHYYGTHNELVRWWISLPYSNDEITHQEAIIPKFIITPTAVRSPSGNSVTLSWDESHDYGFYNIERRLDYRTNLPWETFKSNVRLVTNNPEYIIQDYNPRTQYRIVHYRTQFNIPDIFFKGHFNFPMQAEKFETNRVVSYNPEMIDTTESTVSYSDKVYARYTAHHEIEPRNTEIDLKVRSYQNSTFGYPNSQLAEHLWQRYNTEFFDNISWVESDYNNITTHDGSELKNCNFAKYPINSQWNWAIDDTYYYLCYESCKWNRTTVDIIDDSYMYANLIDDPDNWNLAYNDRFYINGDVYIKVSTTKWAKVTSPISDEWDPTTSDLFPDGTYKWDSEFSRIATVAIVSPETYYKITQNQISPYDYITYTIDPHYKAKVKTVTYEKFLKYLKTYDYVIDSKGYIHKDYSACLDRNGFMYLRVYDTANCYPDPSTYEVNKVYKWVRTTCNLFWKNNGNSIYNSNTSNLGYQYPLYGMVNRHDSHRMLNGTMYPSASSLNNILNPEEGDTVAVLNSSTYYPDTYTYTKMVNSSDVISYSWVRNIENKIQKTDLGMNQNLLEFIDEKYAENKQNYRNISNTLLDTLGRYLQEVLRESEMDIQSVLRVGFDIERTIINFYKPKRARPLLIAMIVRLSERDNSRVTVEDEDYNPIDYTSDIHIVGKDKEAGLLNRTRIEQNINDYIPRHDMIYSKDNQLISESLTNREFITGVDIPSIHLYDKYETRENWKCILNSNEVTASFYVDKFSVSINGFYFRNIKDGIYTNTKNRIVRITLDNGLCRWVIGNIDSDSASISNSIYISESDDLFSKYYTIDSENRENNFLGSETSGYFNNNDTVEINGRDIEAVLYLDKFEMEQCNGFYFYDESSSMRYGKPVYFNLNGKIISFINTEYNWNGSESFWMISSKKQILDLKDAHYIIYTDKLSDGGIETLTTGRIYKVYEDPNNMGFNYHRKIYKVQDIIDHPELINPVHYSHTSLSDLYNVNKRNHFNQVRLRYEPISDFRFKNVVNDEYDYMYSTVTLSGNPSYTMNQIGTIGGAITLTDDSFIGINVDSKVKTSAYRFKLLDYNEIFSSSHHTELSTTSYGKLVIKISGISTASISISDIYHLSYDHYTVTPTSLTIYTNILIRKDFWNYIIESIDDNTLKLYVNNIELFSVSGTFVNTFSNTELFHMRLSEYSVWDQIIPDWYRTTLYYFGSIRRRLEPNVSTTPSLSSWSPVFALSDPRVVYGKECTGLPETYQGPRMDGYVAKTVNGINHPEEMSLWYKYVNTAENRKLIVQDNCDSFNENIPLNIGVCELTHSGMRTGRFIQDWWLREDSNYKTGPIHHRPVYIATRQIVNEIYPVNSHTEQCADYYDIGKNFDGDSNIDNSTWDGIEYVSSKLDKIELNDSCYDEHTTFSSTSCDLIDNDSLWPVYKPSNWIWVDLGSISTFQSISSGTHILDIISKDSLTDFDIDWRYSLQYCKYSYPHRYFVNLDTNKIINPHNLSELNPFTTENMGSTYCNPCGTPMVSEDIDQNNITRNQKSNLIFHEMINAESFSDEYSILNGQWVFSSIVESKKENDFNHCYKLGNALECIPTFQLSSGYYWWEIRQLVNQEWITIARTLVNDKIHSSDRRAYFDMINGNQLDICNQPMCVFNSSDYDTFINSDYHDINQITIPGFFNTNRWITFPVKILPKVDIDTSRDVRIDCINNKLYVKVVDTWFEIGCETEWAEGIIVQPDSSPTCSGYMLLGNYLYIHSGRWVRVHISNTINPVPEKIIMPWTFVYIDNSKQPKVLLNTDISALNITNFGGITDSTKWLSGSNLMTLLRQLIQLPLRDDSVVDLYMTATDSFGIIEFDNSYIRSNVIDIQETNFKTYSNSNLLGFSVRDPRSPIKDRLDIQVFELIGVESDYDGIVYNRYTNNNNQAIFISEYDVDTDLSGWLFDKPYKLCNVDEWKN